MSDWGTLDLRAWFPPRFDNDPAEDMSDESAPTIEIRGLHVYAGPNRIASYDASTGLWQPYFRGELVTDVGGWETISIEGMCTEHDGP